jgi:DNA-binding transcriptional regulator LsrR (DeoR family)
VDRAAMDLVAAGKTVLFIGAGFAIAPPDGAGKTRDRGGLREYLVTKYADTLKEARRRADTLSLEDLVFALNAQGISRSAIGETIRQFVLSADELGKLKAFGLLRELLSARPRIFEAIITTNWDKGLENNLRGVSGLDVQELVTDEDCLQYSPNRLSIIKIHGDVDKVDSIILSSQDFDVYERTHPRMVERLRILFSTKHLILLGYSARDENFRRIYRALHYDIGNRLPGGWIVAPEIADRERMWVQSVSLSYVKTTADSFLSEVLSYVVRVPLGRSNKAAILTSARRKYFEEAPDLAKVARRLVKRYRLREVWVARLRETDGPNKTIGQVAAHFVESRCRNVRSLAVSTGETMEAMAAILDASVFRRRVTVLPTVVILAGPLGFKDPSHIIQQMVGRFDPGRAAGVPLRLPSDAYVRELLHGASRSELGKVFAAVRLIATRQIDKAMAADVILASVRPPDWFGGDGPRGDRTVPVQWLSGSTHHRLRSALQKRGVVAVHQMILLDSRGQDTLPHLADHANLSALEKLTCRPKVEQLRAAAASSRSVVLVAAHDEKSSAVSAVLNGRLCNTLIVDESLAASLANA